MLNEAAVSADEWVTHDRCRVVTLDHDSGRRVLNEARLVQRTGTTVTVLAPGPDDLRLIGHNLMAPSRRRLVLHSAIRSGRGALDDPTIPPGTARIPGPDLDES